MNEYAVIRKSDGKEVYRYSHESLIEWVDFPFSEFDHVEQPPILEELVQVSSANWKIWVGSFFDRFGDYKLPILSSDDSIIRAAITDASVRKYIDLKERHEELTYILAYMQSKGFAVDITATLDLVPTEDEVWHE